MRELKIGDTVVGKAGSSYEGLSGIVRGFLSGDPSQFVDVEGCGFTLGTLVNPSALDTAEELETRMDAATKTLWEMDGFRAVEVMERFDLTFDQVQDCVERIVEKLECCWDQYKGRPCTCRVPRGEGI